MLNWTSDPPKEAGNYLVRPILDEFCSDGQFSVPSRLVWVGDWRGRFDAGLFGGSVEAPCWEWCGPITTPEGV